MLKQLQIKGFKTIRDQTIDLGKINVLIGANGAGKSNFVSFFKMLNSMVSGNLQLYIGQAGGANDLLYYGSEITSQVESKLIFKTDSITSTYYMRLVYATGDTFIFADEWVSSSKKGIEKTKAPKTPFVPGQKESVLTNNSGKNKTLKVIQDMITKCRYFQFHDTSETAKIKQNGYIEDNRYLRSDAGNLAAYLYMLRETKRLYYDRIISAIRQIIPSFDDFVLERGRLNENYIMLNWKEKNSDLTFGSHQLSDGSLRMMALIALLFQPKEFLPEVILIDEPELGLHPYALEILVSLLRYVSDCSQIVIATQSSDLIDYFEPDEIVVTERRDKESIFKRLDNKELEEWREEYTMSELWKKNVLGGRPS